MRKAFNRIEVLMSSQNTHFNIKKGELLYEGKAKRIYAVIEQLDLILHEFKDSLTAFNGQKKDTLEGKSQINTAISSLLFQYLKTKGFETHFVAQVTNTMLLTKRLQMIPLEVVIRNQVAGSLKNRLGLKEGIVINPPLIELYLKSDKLKDPLINEGHVLLLKILDQKTLNHLKNLALKVNTYLTELFNFTDLILIDFKLEFGVNSNGQILLGDEISPDTCRIWDVKTGEKLDKDRFRYDLGDIKKSYQKIQDQLTKAMR